MLEFKVDDDLRVFAQHLNSASTMSAKELARLTKVALRSARPEYLNVVADNFKQYRINKAKVRGSFAKPFMAINSGSGGTQALMRSGWLPMIRAAGVKQTSEGVEAPGLGMHRSAFLQTMPNGKLGVFARIRGTSMQSKPYKEQIRELYHLNPNREEERGNSDALEKAGDVTAQRMEADLLAALKSLAD